MALYRPTIDGVVTISTCSINPITRTHQKQLNMSLPTSSSPSRNASSSRVPTAPISTSAQPTQGQSSQTSTAKNPPYDRWIEPNGDPENLRYWYRHYKPIKYYTPPAPESRVPGPTESVGSLTSRKRLADSAASFERTKVPRPDTGVDHESDSTAKLWADHTVARLLEQRRAQIRAREVEAESTPEAQSSDDDVTAADHHDTSQATARSESFAHSARVGAVGQVHEREQNRAKSTRLPAEQSRPVRQYQTDISISASSIAAFPRPRYDVPSSTGEAGDIGRAWIQRQKRKTEKLGNQGGSGYRVEE